MATQIIEVREASPPRRQFSDDDKARVVSEAMMPGSSVTAVARRHRICASLIYRWRRELRKRGVVTAVHAACANGSAMAGCQFHGMSSSQPAAGQSFAILAMTTAI